MISTDHVIINQSFITRAASTAPAIVGMDSERMVVGVNAAQIPGHFGPISLSPFRAETNFTRQNPDHPIGSVTRDQITPVPLEIGSPESLHAVAITPPPCADNRWHKSGVHEMFDPPVRGLKILRIDHTHILRQVWLTAFILQAWLEEIFIGIRSADNLHHGESLGLAVCG